MRGRPALRGGQAEHATGVEIGGIRRRQICGDQDARLRRQIRQATTFSRRVKLRQHAPADITQVRRAPGQHRIAQRRQPGGDLLDGLVP